MIRQEIIRLLADPIMGLDDEGGRLQAEIAERLRLFCAAIEQADGVSQAEVGRRCGADSGAWSHYLIGKRGVPMTVLRAARREYGADLSWFVLNEAERNSPAFQAKLDAYRKAPPDPNKPKRGRPPKGKPKSPAKPRRSRAARKSRSDEPL